MKLHGSVNSDAVIRHNARSLHEIERRSERLSSGRRINGGKDDAAGLSISIRMRARVSSLRRVQQNLRDGLSLVQTTENSLLSLTDEIIKARELAVRALGDTLTTSDRLTLDADLQATLGEVRRMAEDTEFQGIKPLQRDMILPPTRVQIGVMTTEANTTVTGALADFATALKPRLAAMKRADVEVEIGLVVSDLKHRTGPGTTITLADFTKVLRDIGDGAPNDFNRVPRLPDAESQGQIFESVFEVLGATQNGGDGDDDVVLASLNMGPGVKHIPTELRRQWVWREVPVMILRNRSKTSE